MRYSVKEFRAAGLEARWSRTSNGAPIIVARNPASKLRHQRETWWAMDARMWKRAEKDGILEAFDGATMMGDMFSVPL